MEARPEQLNIVSTDDGLHLDGSILWFDSKRGAGLSFLSSASSELPNNGPQVIATEETIKILEANRKKPNALVCQYNRPFSIGKLKMELLPSGCILGGASLHVETENRKFLYAPALQTQRISTVRQMQLKRANVLILGAHYPDPNFQVPNRKKERERLLEMVSTLASQGQFPIILCNPYATAQELTQFLFEHQISVAVHPAIHRVHRVYEAYGSRLGEYSIYSPRHTKKKVLLFPIREFSRGRKRRPLPDGPVIVVDDSSGEMNEPNFFREAVARFHMSSSCDGRDLKDVIAVVNPREVFLFGPYIKKYMDELKNTGVKIRPLFSNQQPTLF